MTVQPLVSVIIPTFQSARYIVEAVESVLGQTYAPIEIIVVDDGSTDDTRERLRPYFDRLRYVYLENSGPSKARNHGVRLARGELIAFLDADDRWLSNKLETQIRCLMNEPTAALVHSTSLVGETSFAETSTRDFSGGMES
jgi:glycosyltransferase involved in cell wall biosynthesis